MLSKSVNYIHQTNYNGIMMVINYENIIIVLKFLGARFNKIRQHKIC